MAPRPRTDEATRPRRLLDLGSTWPLFVAFALVVAIVAWRAPALVRSLLEDETSLAARPWYGFDVTPLDPTRLREHTLGYGGLKPLDDPPVLTPAELLEERGMKAPVTRDRVIGVVVGDAARAYPIRFLNWHEVVNDTLGGVPVAVTYCPLSDSVGVYRRVLAGAPDEPLRLRFSGLVYDSNTLLYDDRQRPAERSLWSQLTGAAVAGPASRPQPARLERFSALLLPYGEWLALHPDTTVIDGDPQLHQARRYGKHPYDTYFQGGGLLYPVAPAPPADGPPPLERTLVLEWRGTVRHLTHTEIARHTGDASPWRTTVGDLEVTVHKSVLPDCAWVTTDLPAPRLGVRNMAWFAAHIGRHRDDTAGEP